MRAGEGRCLGQGDGLSGLEWSRFSFLTCPRIDVRGLLEELDEAIEWEAFAEREPVAAAGEIAVDDAFMADGDPAKVKNPVGDLFTATDLG